MDGRAKKSVKYAVHCVADWAGSPFVLINPGREALFGRGPCFEAGAVVALDFRSRETTISLA